MKFTTICIAFIVSLCVISCSSKRDPTLEPVDNGQQKPTSGTHSENPAVSEPGIVKDADTGFKDTDTIGVRLSVFIPPDDVMIPQQFRSVLESRLMTLLTRRGLGGRDASPRFALVPAVSLLSKNVTATAPPMYANTYEVTLYVVDMERGTVFGTSSQQTKGVGRDAQSAFMTAINSINLDDAGTQKFLGESQKKLLAYFETHCGELLQDAKATAQHGNNQNALALLQSIPMESTVCYHEAQTIAGPIADAAAAQNCGQILANMKAELGKNSSRERGGFNERAMGYYTMISRTSPCYQDAEATYTKFVAALEPDAQDKWTQQEKEFEMRSQQQGADNEYRRFKTEIDAKVADQGQAALLKKYQQDYEYDKLPWLRKLIHLGNVDPFDRSNN